MKFPKENILDNWLEENRNPEADKFIEQNLAITEKVCRVLKDRGISKADFAEILGKNPSEVSKWLSGLHNLTLKSITKMSVALDLDLINVEPEYKYVYFGSVKGNDLQERINDYEETADYQQAM